MGQKSQAGAKTILIGAAFLAGVDLFIVNVAFDDIGQDFAGSELSELSWILTAYAVVYAALLVPMGRLADRAGQKRFFIGGMALFVAASVACGFAPGIWWLVAFRVAQAAGAAAMTPASLGLLLAIVPPADRARSARLWALVGAVAAAVGPALGGGLVQISWQWAFWINLPVGLLLIVGAVRVLPDLRLNVRTPIPDLLGALVLTVSIGALVLGVVQGNEWGWRSAGVLGAFAGAAVGLGVFAARTRTHRAPIIAPSMLAVPSFRWANASTLVFNVGFGAALLGAILWLQQVWGYGALETGLAIALGPLMVPVTSLIVHRVLPRTRPGLMIAAGSLVFAVSAVWLSASLTSRAAYLTDFLPAWLLAGIGVGLALPNLVAAATSDLPPEQSSTGGGVVNMARQVGLALGISILVAVLGGPGTADDFTRAWYVVAAVMVVAALAAVRITTVAESSRTDAPSEALARATEP